MEGNNPNKCRRKLLKSIAVGKSLPELWRRQFTINFRNLPLEPFKVISAFRTSVDVLQTPLADAWMYPFNNRQQKSVFKTRQLSI